MVDREVGLDDSGRSCVQLDHEHARALDSVDAGPVLRLDLLERVPAVPPAPNVLAIQPLAEKREILVVQQPERDVEHVLRLAAVCSVLFCEGDGAD